MRAIPLMVVACWLLILGCFVQATTGFPALWTLANRLAEAWR